MPAPERSGSTQMRACSKYGSSRGTQPTIRTDGAPEAVRADPVVERVADDRDGVPLQQRAGSRGTISRHRYATASTFGAWRKLPTKTIPLAFVERPLRQPQLLVVGHDPRETRLVREVVDERRPPSRIPSGPRPTAA